MTEPNPTPQAPPSPKARKRVNLREIVTNVRDQLATAVSLPPGPRLLALREMMGTYAITTRSRQNMAILLELAKPHERAEVLRELIRLQDAGVSGDDLRLAVGAFTMGRPVTRAEVGLAELETPAT